MNRRLLALIILFAPLPVWAEDARPEQDFREVLDFLNGYRERAGLDPVRLNPEGTLDARLHAEYLQLNAGKPELRGLEAHREYDYLPGYSEAGQDAGGDSGISHIGHPTDGIDQLMATVIHRHGLIGTGQSMGIGFSQGATLLCRCGGDEWLNRLSDSFFLDYYNRPWPPGAMALERDHLTLYPGPGQWTPLTDFQDEIPNPIPPGEEGDWGYPITVFKGGWSAQPQLNDVHLEDDTGHAVPLLVLPSTAQFDFVPREPLVQGRTYRLQLQIDDEGHVEHYDWTFRVGTPR